MSRLGSSRSAWGLALGLGVVFLLSVFLAETDALVVPTVLTVNSTADDGDADLDDDECRTASGDCTLRAAIEQANATDGPHDIEFAIPGAGVHTILPSTPLPGVETTLRILGFTQPGSAAGDVGGTIRIALDGSNAPNSGGLTFELGADGCRVEGLAITRFALGGVRLTGGSSTISKCYLGLDPDGAAAGNGSQGVLVLNGTHAIQDSVISATTTPFRPTPAGILVESGTARISGNYIGTDPSGSEARPNLVGIRLRTDGHQIENNVISSNTISAIAFYVLLPQGQGTRILNNRIGTDASGDNPLPNGSGIAFDETFRNSSDDAENLVEGNLIAHHDGTAIDRPHHDIIRGNTIVENGTAIFIDRGAQNRILENTVAHNTLAIIVGLNFPQAVGNTIRRNSIFDNFMLGIDHRGENISTPNDPGDADEGPNDLQNHPELLSAVGTGSSVLIEGRLESSPSSSFALDFYASDTCPNAPIGSEGQRFVGSTNLSTDSAGLGEFSLTFSGPFGDDFYTATATNSGGSTSEFSPCVGGSGGPGTIEFAQATYRVLERRSDVETIVLEVEIVRTGGLEGDASIEISTADDTAVAPDDYLVSSGTIEFQDGIDAVKTHSIFVVADDVSEPDESFVLRLDALSGGATLGAQRTAEVVLVDESAVAVSFAFAAYSFREDRGEVDVEVRLDSAVDAPVEIEVVSFSGNAQAAVDFSAPSAVLRFQPGETSKPVPIAILQDDSHETTEQFRLDLRVPPDSTSVLPGDFATTTVHIEDDDPPVAGVVQFRVDEIAIGEGSQADSAELHLVRTGGTQGELRYRIEFGFGSAEEDVDFFLSGGEAAKTVVFEDGQDDAIRWVEPIGDDEFERGEFVFVHLIPLDGAVVGQRDIMRIRIDDPSIGDNGGFFFISATGQFIHNVTLREGEASLLGIRRSGNDPPPASVDVVAYDLSTESGIDYEFARETVEFDAGENIKAIVFTALTDSDLEGREDLSTLR